MKLGENFQKITVGDTIKYLTSVFLLQDKTNVINLKRKMDNELAKVLLPEMVRYVYIFKT